jgi:uncharacterized repeat protein (TIGR03803 family)
MRSTVSWLAIVGLAMVAIAPGQSRAADLTTLYSFCSLANCTDGAHPPTDGASGGLLADADGNLFGTTSAGGAGNNGGTVFEIAKTASGYASTPTTLVSFCSQPNCADGSSPAGSLIADADGNLFGTTSSGGAGNNGGSVFEIVKTSHRRGRDADERNLHLPGLPSYANTPTTLVSFCSLANCADGSGPASDLIVDAKGNLFGTTSVGGANGRGTVFEIVKTARGYASTPTTLVSFCAQPNCADGSGPFGGLIADAKGNLFGTTLGLFTTEFEGHITIKLVGTVFEIAKTASGYASTPTTLVSFVDGRGPAGSLIADAQGNLFGVTVLGGTANNRGTVFEIAKTASGYASTPITLVSFCSLSSSSICQGPAGGVIADAKGNLFGMTIDGGVNGDGTVFEIVKTASGYASTPTTLVSFCSLANCADGSGPRGRLIADTKGNLLGTTFSGGADNNGNGGTVFEITDSGFVVRHKFDGTPGSPSCFGQSVSALIQKYGGLIGAADELSHPSVPALQDAIMEFCEG